MNVVEVQGLTKSFNGIAALRGVSMSVDNGDVYGLLGPNGSGKTTTLRVLLGILERDGGEVSVLGMDPSSTGDRLRREVNILPESHGFYDWMRSADYLRFFAQLYGRELSYVECQDRLGQVGLARHDRRPIRAFSRGMKQRLGIARALLNDPRLLLLDEPTNGLDPRGRRETHDLLLTLNKEKGTTIVISSHILGDVEQLCNRVAILDGGRTRYEGPVSNRPGTASRRYRFKVAGGGDRPLGERFPGVALLDRNGPWLTCALDGVTPAQAIKSLVEGGVALEEAEPVAGGLEDLYMEHIARGTR